VEKTEHQIANKPKLSNFTNKSNKGGNSKYPNLSVHLLINVIIHPDEIHNFGFLGE
jgi:hypothetical protein